MDELQAAILRVKLKRLPMWTDERKLAAFRYRTRLRILPGIKLQDHHNDHVYHIFAMRVTDPRGRAQLGQFLESKGIEVAFRYTTPMHLQPALRFLRHRPGDFPNAERWAQEVINLPMYPELTYEEVDYICEVVKEWVGQGG